MLSPDGNGSHLNGAWVMEKIFYLITGGTFVDVTPHFALAAPAFGTVGRELEPLLTAALAQEGWADVRVIRIRTRMALGEGERTLDEWATLNQAGLADLRTNADLARLIDALVGDPRTKGMVLPVAVCDFEPKRLTSSGGVTQTVFGRTGVARLSSRETYALELGAGEKLVARVRHERKDIFLVSFKTTVGLTEDGQYLAGLDLLKRTSSNLVLANDLETRTSLVITPEQARYHVTTERAEALRGLAEMVAARAKLRFTRATVVSGEAIPWQSEAVPEALRVVVDHCIVRGAYKPFLGATVGHFAVRGPDGLIYTSRRKTDFNRLAEIGLVAIEPRGTDAVIAYGAKPSVGGQSQRVIFTAHPELDCIVHFHCPLRPGVSLSTRTQRPYECGSHECGENTNAGLQPHGRIQAVMLDKHGPNVVFPRDIDPREVISFIEAHFDLEASTDGLPKRTRRPEGEMRTFA